MKDGRTHLAHKAEHAVDLATGAIVAVTLQGADKGDTTTVVETAIAAAEQIEDAQADVEEPQSLEEIVADKGYHSNQTMVDLDDVGIRSYVSEPDRGRRDWSEARRPRRPCMPIADAFAANGDADCCANAASGSSGRLRISMTPVGCGGRTCGGTRTF
jgi:hypothetical protein